MEKEKEKKKEENKIDIKDRIVQLQGEIQMHRTKLSQAQQVANIETQQVIAKQGAIEELKKFI